MDAVQLTATKRSVRGKQVGQLRRAGQLPGVLYGPGLEPMPIQLDAREAGRLAQAPVRVPPLPGPLARFPVSDPA